MLIAVLSDVHANLDALDAVLARAREDGASRFYVLGDLVGYGADPQGVLDRLTGTEGVTLIAGNHDHAACGRFDARWFNSMAFAAIRWTAQVLGDDALALLSSLEPRAEVETGLLVHGSVVDPIAEYVLTAPTATASFDAASFDVCFFGHTHMPTLFARSPDGTVAGQALVEDRRVALDDDVRYLLNPGSVGQPRDGDPRAAYLLYDTDARAAVLRRVPYDVESAAAKIVEATLPPYLAERLALGR